MKYYEIGLFFASAVSLASCQNGGEGAKETVHDTSIKASAKLKEGFDDGANMARNAAEEISVAARLTPRIKTAITADPKLNADGNLIDVDSRPEKVSLSGHVNSQALKDLAGKIALDEIAKAKATQKFVNDLVVKEPKK